MSQQQAKRPSSWVKPAADTAPKEPVASHASMRAYAVINHGGGWRLVTLELPQQVAELHEVKRTEPDIRPITLALLSQSIDEEHGL